MRKATLVSFLGLLLSSTAFAQAAGAAVTTGFTDKGLFALGLGLALGLGAIGATLGEGKVGASAMEGLARNPQARNSMFVPMIVVLALIESLFILTWLIAFSMSGKL